MDIEKVLLEIRSTGTFLSQPHFWVLLSFFGQYLNEHWNDGGWTKVPSVIIIIIYFRNNNLQKYQHIYKFVHWFENFPTPKLRKFLPTTFQMIPIADLPVEWCTIQKQDFSHNICPSKLNLCFLSPCDKYFQFLWPEDQVKMTDKFLKNQQEPNFKIHTKMVRKKLGKKKV